MLILPVEQRLEGGLGAADTHCREVMARHGEIWTDSVS